MEIPGHRMRRTCSFLILGLVTATLFGQSQLSGTIQATGNATLSLNPDQATLDAGVITSGASAQEMASVALSARRPIPRAPAEREPETDSCGFPRAAGWRCSTHTTAALPVRRP